MPAVDGGILLDDFLAQHGELDEPTFLERCPHPVLVVSIAPTGEGGFETVADVRRTQLVDRALAERIAERASSERGAGDRTLHADRSAMDRVTGERGRPQRLVFPVAKRWGESLAAQRVTIGRARTNDISLREDTVSKFHAFFRLASGGESVQITDVSSTNGTFVQGKRLPPKTPHLLNGGEHIQFGPNVTGVFYMPGGFHRFMRTVGTRSRG